MALIMKAQNSQVQLFRDIVAQRFPTCGARPTSVLQVVQGPLVYYRWAANPMKAKL